MIPNNSSRRVRTQGVFLPGTYSYNRYLGNGSFLDTVSGNYAPGYGTVKTMLDYVSKPFLPGVTFVNSPMTSSEVTVDRPPLNYRAQHSNPNATAHGSSLGTAQYADKSVKFGQYLNALPQKENALIRQATTSALANARKPDVSGIVSIVELKETIQSLLNPVQGALKFLSRNAPSKKKKRRLSKNSLKRSVDDLANQHLTIIFGIMPFISDIQGILKALESVGPLPVKQTARGNASAFDQSTNVEEYIPYQDASYVQNATETFTVQRTITVRAYLLYETTVTLQQALGLGITDIPKSVWQAATLSFVVDWFANVGDYISSITPMLDVKVLSSGFSVTTVTACNANISIRGGPPAGVTTNYWSTWHDGSQSRVEIAKRRVPADLTDYRGLAIKSNMHKDVLDAFKITAGISLLTQRLGKFL